MVADICQRHFTLLAHMFYTNHCKVTSPICTLGLPQAKKNCKMYPNTQYYTTEHWNFNTGAGIAVGTIYTVKWCHKS
jgi:hypothetical protein